MKEEMESKSSNGFNFKKVLQFACELLIAAIVVCGVFFTCSKFGKKPYSYEIYERKTELKYEEVRADLLRAVDSYIREKSPNSVMNSFAFLDASDEYDIDLRFMLAQCQLESNFSTAGIAMKTLSAFNVYAYDGKSASKMMEENHKYRHPDLSIADYCKMLNSKYIVAGKTEFDMMDKYVNAEGKRYASSPDYEMRLRMIFDTISNETQIGSLYQEYIKYKIICQK